MKCCEEECVVVEQYEGLREYRGRCKDARGSQNEQPYLRLKSTLASYKAWHNTNIKHIGSNNT
jgi:hypothetical protein